MNITTANIRNLCLPLNIPFRYRREGYIVHLAYRLSSRIARRYNYDLDTMTGVLYYYVYCYLYQYIPVKQLAIHTKRTGERLEISFSDKSLKAFSTWDIGEMPLLMLACLAEKLGIDYRLSGDALEISKRFEIGLHHDAVPLPGPNRAYETCPSRTLVALGGLRDYDATVWGDDDFAFFCSDPRYRNWTNSDIGFQVAPQPFLTKPIRVGWTRKPQSDRLNYQPSLLCLLDNFIIPVLDVFLPEAHKFVREACISKLYITDHPFMENYLLKEAVLAEGGSVHLLSHGLNPTAMDLASKNGISSITVSCWTSADIWSRFTRAPIKVKPTVIANRSTLKTGKHRPNTKPSIHIFGCAEFIGLLPQNEPDVTNTEIYLRLLQAAGTSDANIYFRSRALGVSFPMLKNTAFGTNLLPGELPPTQITGDNMVFIFVGPATSGIHEAIGRGIPVLRATLPGCSEYLHVDERVVPILEPENAMALALSLGQGNGYDDVALAQFTWLSDETREGEISSTGEIVTSADIVPA